MTKVTVFYLISSKFFVDLFLGMLILFSRIPNKDPPAYYLFDFLGLKKHFFRPKSFFRLFRPKKFFKF